MNTDELIKFSIQKEIRYRRNNSLWNHFLTIVKFNSDGLSGKATVDNFIVWTYSRWTGIFYPIITGHLLEDKIKIDSKMNPVGQIFAVLIAGLYSYALLIGVVIQEDNSWEFLWKRIVVSLFMLSIPIGTFSFVFRREYRKERERIKDLCRNNLSMKKI